MHASMRKVGVRTSTLLEEMVVLTSTFSEEVVMPLQGDGGAHPTFLNRWGCLPASPAGGWGCSPPSP